tara:strand:- start:364 stop:498 length:135 start_codon:yes stop_codon:yes gene_type:complete
MGSWSGLASKIGFPSSPHLPTSGLMGISPKNSNFYFYCFDSHKI